MSLISHTLERAKKTKAYRRLKRERPIDKKSYISRNRLDKLVPRGEFPPEFVYASSGSTGQASFWFRDKRQEKIGALIHERIVRDTWKIKKSDPTLVIICFSMGVWVAGNYTAESFHQLSRRGYKLTVATPGIEQADILQLFRRVAPFYKKVIIAGYPPFVMDVMTEVKQQAPSLLRQDLYFLTAGDKFSEKWRTNILKLIGRRERSRAINVYGSADAGVMGYETPLTSFLREKLPSKHSLRRDLVLEDNFVASRPATLPGLYEYDPSIIHFENLDKELVVTADTVIPLVKYNTHDLGRVLSARELAKILKRHGLLASARRHGLRENGRGFVLLRGRSDVAVTFYALNIYPENIQAGLEDKRLAKYATGNFNAYVTETKNSERQELRIAVEIKPGVKPSQKLKKLAEKILTDNLLKLNAEFRKLTASVGQRARPKLSLVAFGVEPRLGANTSLVFHHGKKPRIVLKDK